LAGGGGGASRHGSTIVKMNIVDGREHEIVTAMVPTEGVVVVEESIVGDAWMYGLNASRSHIYCMYIA